MRRTRFTPLVLVIAGLVAASCSLGAASPAEDRRAAAVETTAVETTVGSTVVGAPGDTAISPASSSLPAEEALPATTVDGGGDPTVDPAPTQPAESFVETCFASVTVGPLTVAAGEAACLDRVGLTWSSTAAVTVGGVRFVPLGPQARLVFDPFNARVKASGYEAVGSLLGADLVLASGEIDWSFQYRPDQNTGLGRFMPTKSDIIDLALIAQLPGLEGVRSLPKDPVSGFADYSAVPDESVGLLAERFPSLAGPDVVIPLSAIGLTAVPRLTVSLPTDIIQSITGLDVGGAVTIQPVERGGVLGVVVGGTVRLPSVLERAEGVFAVFVPLQGSAEIDELRVDIPRIEVGAGRIEDLLLEYEVPTKTWSGRALVLVGPGADAIGVGGTISIVDGDLKTIGVQVAGLPVDIGGVVSINRLGGTLRLDPFSLEATGQLGVGPFVPSVGNLAVIDGGVAIGETEVAVSGVMKIGTLKILGRSLPGLQVADARVSYRWDGVASISGNGYLSFDVGETWSIRGGLRGAANASALSVAGDVALSLGPLLQLSGVAAIGTKGVVACGLIGSTWFASETRVGISHDWGSGRVELRGKECNTDAYEVPVNPVPVAAPASNDPSSGGSRQSSPVAFVRAASPVDSVAGSVEVEVPAGQQMLTIALDANDDSLQITGPDGTLIDLSDGGASTDDPTNPRWVVLEPPGSEVRSVLVGSPAGGTWSVEGLDAGVETVRAELVSAQSRPVQLAAEVLEAVPAPPDTTDQAMSTTTEVPPGSTQAAVPPTVAPTDGPADGPAVVATSPTSAGADSESSDGSTGWIILVVVVVVAAAGATIVRSRRR